MENERLPIKFFAPREIDELTVEGGGSSEIPKWVLEGDDLKQRSEELISAFNQFTEPINEHFERESAVPFVFIAKMCDDSTAKSRRKNISSLFRIGYKSNVIGVADSDALIVKLDSVSQMNKISGRLRDYNRNRFALSCLETFWKFKPTVQRQDGEAKYKIKLIDFQDYETNVSMQRSFEQTLTSHEILFKKTSYTNLFPVYKVEMQPQAMLDKLMGSDALEMLFSIEPMPKYGVSLDSIEETINIKVMTPDDGCLFFAR